jgi:hypothetical protein
MPRRAANQHHQEAAILLLLVLLLSPLVSLCVDASKGFDRHLLRLAGDQPGPDMAAAPVAAPAAAPTAAAAGAAVDADPAVAAADAAAGVDTSVAATTLVGGACLPGCGWYGYHCYGCRAGWYSPGGRHPKCLPCPVGSVSTAGSTTCTLCKDLPGKGPGWTTWSRGSTRCDYCLPGYAGAGCGKCLKGTWSRGGRANSRLVCQNCPGGWDTMGAGAKTPTACTRECLCVVGWEWGGGGVLRECQRVGQGQGLVCLFDSR